MLVKKYITTFMMAVMMAVAIPERIGQMVIQANRRTGAATSRRPICPLLAATADAGRLLMDQALRSTFGATLRYQPSLMAFSQSPPGKVGIVVGTTSLYFS